jgi:hypothetical protein
VSVVLAAVALAMAASTAGSGGWYLSGPGGSQGVLVAAEGGAPPGSGVVVQVEPGEHVEFVADHDGLELDGRAVVRLWTTSAQAGMEAAGVSGEIRVSLLACEQGVCRGLAATRILEEPWGRGDSLELKSVELPAVRAALEPEERICLRIDVLGDRPVVLGYGSSEHPSSIDLSAATTRFADGGDGHRPAESDAVGNGPVLGDDRSDLVSRPGLGFGVGLARTDGGLFAPILVALVITSTMAGLGMVVVADRQGFDHGGLRTRRPPDRRVRR